MDATIVKRGFSPWWEFYHLMEGGGSGGLYHLQKLLQALWRPSHSGRDGLHCLEGEMWAHFGGGRGGGLYPLREGLSALRRLYRLSGE